MESYPVKAFLTLLALNVSFCIFFVGVAHSDYKESFEDTSAKIAAVVATPPVVERRKAIPERPKVIPAKTLIATMSKVMASTTERETQKRTVAKQTSKPVAKKVVKTPANTEVMAPAKAPVAEKVETPKVAQAPVFIPVSKPVEKPAPKKAVNTPVQSDSVAELEQMVIDLMNDERVKKGLSRLSSDTKLASIARTHSADMLAKDFFSHKNLSGCSPSCRMDNAGYQWKSNGENIHMMSGFNFSLSETADKIVSDWMNSPGHKANILGNDFTNIGVGIVSVGDKYYTTAEYSLPK